jgi:acyl-CoA reductase-like NAD-dependent aldehyde dehydrogenase
LQQLWINNRMVPSTSRAEIAVVNPATEEVIDTIPRGSTEDVQAAVSAARRGGSGWAELSPKARARLLARVADRIQALKGRLSQLLTLENGKPLGQAEADVDGTVDILRHYAELGSAFRSGTQGAPGGELAFQQWEPRGVAACIVPWNYPLQAAMNGVAPNLIVGNTVVLKPSEKTPLTALLLSEAFAELPNGSFNVVLGDGPHAGAPLVAHRDVDVVFFTGSVSSGRKVGEVCGARTCKAILELGGKDPMIVDETVDIPRAARLAAAGAFVNTGQICTSVERIYVHRSVFDFFVSELVKEAATYRPGASGEPGVNLGPLIDRDQLDKVQLQVDLAVQEGATLLCGGERLARKGFFFPPTVLTNVSHSMLIMREETFGPVAPVMAYDDFDQALQHANETEYGLAAIVCTERADRAIAAIRRLHAGMVKINTGRGRYPAATSEPQKSSGLGAGYGIELLSEITRQKSVHWAGRC